MPAAPTPCSAVQTSYNTMYIDWNAPTSDGGSPIINYNVLIEKGQWKYQVVSSDWDHVEGYWYWDRISLVGHDTVASITARTAVVSPGAYKIVIRARNSVGIRTRLRNLCGDHLRSPTSRVCASHPYFWAQVLAEIVRICAQKRAWHRTGASLVARLLMIV